jgi:hypothetical protein
MTPNEGRGSPGFFFARAIRPLAGAPSFHFVFNVLQCNPAPLKKQAHIERAESSVA